MSSDSDFNSCAGRPKPLEHDPRRVAVPSLRGYVYQVTHTALAWAKLKSGETIFLEYAEDFDRFGRVTEAVQVKDYQRSITLRTPAVRDFICNAWLNRQRNPQRNVQSRLLTTATATAEKGEAFPRPGIELWNAIAGKPPSNEVLAQAEILGRFMLEFANLPEGMTIFLQRANPREILDDVISPVTFDVGLAPIEGIEGELEAHLALVANQAGFRLMNIDNAINATLKQVWDTVVSDSDRVLNIEMLIGVLKETNYTIPSIDEASKQDAISIVAEAVAKMFNPTTTRSTLTLPPILNELPPMPHVHVERVELVEAASSRLREFNRLIINGPRYVGKSTLAGDIARALGDRWAWIDAREASANAIGRARAELQMATESFGGLIIDSVRSDDAVTPELARLIARCDERNLPVIVVPDREFPEPAKQRLGVTAAMEVGVDVFSNAEIARLLLLRGCPSDHIHAWTRALELTTAGDPVLVVARVVNIEASGFALPQLDDVVGRQPDLANIRRDIRLSAANELEPPKLEMLNRLSIASDAYSRAVAIELASKDPAIPMPGNVLDSLVGTWLKEVVPGRYRVLGLALGFGTQTHGDAWAVGMHASAAHAILEQPHITTIEASDALSHAFAGEDEEIALSVLRQIMLLEGDLLDSFAQAGRWLPRCYTGDAKRPEFIPKSKWWMLRAAQVRVAARSTPRIPEPVLEAFEAETPAGSSESSLRTARFIVISELLIRSRTVGLTMSQIASYAVEWAELVHDVAPPDMLTRLAESLGIPYDASADQYAALFVPAFTALGTIKSAAELCELLEALFKFGPRVTHQFFDVINKDYQTAYAFFLPIWSRHIGESGDDWRRTVGFLIRASNLFFELGLQVVADESASAAVRLTVELSSATEALELGDQLLERFQSGSSTTALIRAKARAMMMNLQYEAAACGWQKVLPVVEWDGTDFYLFTDYRDAAISYARRENWTAAAEMLQAGAARVDHNSLGKWKAAMEIDAAMAFFRSRRCEDAVAPVGRACAILSKLDIDQSNDTDYMIMKRIGATLFWMADPHEQSEKGHDPPPPAASSSLDTTRPPQANLAPTEVDMVMALASQYSYLYGFLEDARWLAERGARSPHALARLQAAIVTIYLDGEMGDGPAVVSALARLEEASAALGAPTADHSITGAIAAPLFTFGLIEPGLRSEIDANFIAACRQRARETGSIESLRDVIDQAEQVFVARTIDCDAALHTATGTLQMLASIQVASTLANRPQPWVVIHTLWVELALGEFKQNAGALIYRLMAQRWSYLAQNRFALSRPAITAPQLFAALSSTNTVWNRLAALLEAAADAAGSALPRRVHQELLGVLYEAV